MAKFSAWLWGLGFVVGCSKASEPVKPPPDAAAAVAQKPAVDAGPPPPPPLVRVTLTAVTTPAKISHKDFMGKRETYTPKKGMKFVVVGTQLDYSRCVDRPGDTSWKKKPKKGEPPPVEPKMVRVANIQASLTLPGQEKVQAVGSGMTEQTLTLASYTETGHPCADPEKGSSEKHYFVFTLPKDADEQAATFTFLGVKVPVKAAAPAAP